MLVSKKIENQTLMKQFINSKYKEFIRSIENIDTCQKLIAITEQNLNDLDGNVQKFLVEFSDNYVNILKRREDLQTIKDEREKLKNANIFFAFLNKS